MSTFRTALVTGATGFIGSALVDLLERRGVEVTCLVRSRERLLSSRVSTADIRVIEVPFLRGANLREALAKSSAEVIFNLASYGVQQGNRDSEQLIDGNVSLVARLIEATSDWPLLRFVHAGSCSEYGFPETETIPIAETHALRPVSPYGAAKAASFLFGSALAERLGIPFVSLRLFGVFGPRESSQRLIPYLISKLDRDEPVDLTSGEQVRDYLYEEDAAEAFLEGAVRNLKFYQAYNVCSGVPVRVREIGEAVADAMGKPRHLLHWGERQYRADEPMRLVGDPGRFVEATSWRPRTSVEQGIRRMTAHTTHA